MSNELENESKNYKKKKHTSKAMKPLSTRRYLAGQALAGLLPNSKGRQMPEIKRSAYEWSDYILDDDN